MCKRGLGVKGFIVPGFQCPLATDRHYRLCSDCIVTKGAFPVPLRQSSLRRKNKFAFLIRESYCSVVEREKENTEKDSAKLYECLFMSRTLQILHLK